MFSQLVLFGILGVQLRDLMTSSKAPATLGLAVGTLPFNSVLLEMGAVDARVDGFPSQQYWRRVLGL